jgi:hypothetical protein
MGIEGCSLQHNNEHRITAEALTEVIRNMAMGTSALLSSRTMVAEKRGKYPCNTRATVLHWLQSFPNSRSEEKFQVVRLDIQDQGLLFTHKKIYSDGLDGQSSIPGIGKIFSLPENVQTGSEDHPASIPTAIGGSFPVGKAAEA